MKKFLVALIISASLIGVLPAEVEAVEPYDVILQEVSRYGKTDQEISWIAMAILYAADQCSLDPMLITAVMETESAFNFNARSPVGAIGLMQLMPETARNIGVNPHNPLANVIGGAMYLKTQLNRFAGQAQSLAYAIAAYNAGPQAVINAGGIPNYSETRQYVLKVVNNYNRLQRMRQG